MKYFHKYNILTLFAALALCITNCNSTPGEKHSVTFKVISKNLLPNESVYLTGNNESLGNWLPSAVKLNKESDSVWTKTLSFNKGERIEYKFTLGEWKSEAVNPDGWVFDNFTLTVNNDTTSIIKIDNWSSHVIERVVKAEYFSSAVGGIVLVNNWRYHSGDNPDWAGTEVNDSLWEIAKSDFTEDNPLDKIEKTGWFRTRLRIDSSLWNKTFAFKMQQLGSSEIYYNGKLLFRSPTPKTDWQKFTFEPKAHQVIAVKYVNSRAKTEKDIGLEPGFSIVITDLKEVFNSINDMRSRTVHQMVFTLIPVILSFLHLFLYFFLRKQKQNLYYAFCLLGFAGLTYFNYERFFLNDAGMIIFYQRLNVVSAAVAVFFALLTLFQMSYNKLPKRWLMYLVFFIALLLSGFADLSPRTTTIFIYFYFAFTLLEGIFAGFNKKSAARKESWIIFVGFTIMGIFITLQLLIDFSIVNNYLGINQVHVYGMISFAISMSIYLSYNFAYINKDLESQLVKVKVLSEQAIEQERIAAGLEIERRLIEAENLRKSSELNSARELQLSLLPQKMPQSDKFEIASYMKTATEVGGDYYDFHVSEDDTITAVIGDATGHGLKAGNMVILAKGLFNTLAHEPDLLTIMNTFNRSIKQMNMYMLTMCMSLIRIKDDKLEYSSAGMPPMHIYRKSTGKVEQLILKAMPLGAFYNFPYQKIETELYKGDVILLMSDGLVELFNDQKETYGLENIVESFRTSAEKSPQDIIDCIYRQSTTWSGEIPFVDDLTMIVIKVKE